MITQDGINISSQFINQAVLHQRVGNRSRAVNNDVQAGLLQFRHFFHDIGFNQVAVVPG